MHRHASFAQPKIFVGSPRFKQPSSLPRHSPSKPNPIVTPMGNHHNDLLHPAFLPPCEHGRDGDMHAHAFGTLPLHLLNRLSLASQITVPNLLLFRPSFSVKWLSRCLPLPSVSICDLRSRPRFGPFPSLINSFCYSTANTYEWTPSNWEYCWISSEA